MVRSATSTPSPIGETVEETLHGRLRSDKAFRAEFERLAPYEAIARIVIKRRMELGLTQEEIAKRMGTSNTAISRIESGQHSTKQETLSRLAEALEMEFVQGFRTLGKKPKEFFVTV